ncbi:unnamed protein product [Rotaria sp. Silwood1]|nr:unnamed protein product [Rotaria sp. Silwood1]
MTESNKTSDNINTQIDYTTPTPRFSVTNDNTLKNGLAYMMENGYAVISDILNQDEIIENKNLLWKFLENGDGKITIEDIQLLLQGLGLGSVSPHLSKALFKAIDKNGNGTLDLTDVMALAAIVSKLNSRFGSGANQQV